MKILLSHLYVCSRSGSLKLLLYLGSVSIILALMISAFAGRQPQTLFVDFAFSAIRISMCIGALLWVQEVLVKSLDSKTIVQYLAFPAARSKHILVIFAAVFCALLAATLIFALLTLLVANYFVVGQQSTPVDFGSAFWLTWLFMLLDILVVTTFCILVAVVSTTPFLALIVALAFYIVGHSIQQMLDLLSIAEYIDGRDFFAAVLDVVRYIIPDLSVFDVRYWSLYSEDIVWPQVFKKSLSAFFYMLLCLSLACYSFGRREIV